MNSMNENKQMRLYIDMDNVLMKLNKEANKEKLYRAGYFLNLPVTTSVRCSIKSYMEDHPNAEIYVLSPYLSDSKYALKEKQQWLDEWLPEIDKEHRIFYPHEESKEKYIVGGVRNTDILLAEREETLVTWEAAGGKGVRLIKDSNDTKGIWQGKCIDLNEFIYRGNIAMRSLTIYNYVEHCAGNRRPLETCAEIFLAWASHISQADPNYGYQGYLNNLNYYGERSYDSLKMLKRHIAPESYKKILKIMEQSEARETEPQPPTKGRT